jgi:uridine kinase
MIQSLAEVIESISLAHPTRVAIDGRSAAGKTTLADRLARAIQVNGREVVRASIDDFHRTDHRDRSRRAGWTPQSYYDEGYDYQAFREMMLDPLGPGKGHRCRTTFYDSLNDRPFPESWVTVGDRAIAIIDGVFLLRPEYAGLWDFTIWLDIDMETMVQRACARDVAWVGSVTEVADRYRRHWIPTHELYERLDSPISRAHGVVDNRSHEAPKLLRLSQP